MIILALDIGSSKTGLAISHGIIAEPLLSLDSRKLEVLAEKLLIICREQKVDLIVVGLPLGRDQNETAQSIKARKVADEIARRLKIKMAFVDESFSTSQALRDGRTTDKKFDEDAQSARIILEQYLAENGD